MSNNISDTEKIENIIGLLDPKIKRSMLTIVSDARKEAYSLGFKTAKETYSYKMVPRSRMNTVYENIRIGYQHTTGITDDLFINYLKDKQLEGIGNE